MALADELLDNISEEQFAEYMLVEENPHIVIDKDRNIILPERYKVIAAQGDHNMATYTFDCPRFSDGRDMSKMVVYINYIRSDGETGSYPADNVSIDAQDNNLMHFEWTPLLPATLEHGAFAFLVCVCRTEPDGNMKNHWSTRLCKDATISEGMDCHQNTIIDMYPDVITRILERLNVLEDGGTTSVQYTVQDLEEEQKVQARKNIEAADAKEVSKLSEDIATKASAIKETASGEIIVVTDSDEQEPLELAIDGKSEQNQYSGNQLLDITKQAENASGSIVYNDDGSCTIRNPTGTSIVGFKQILTGLLPAGTYTLKVYEEHVYLQTVSGDYSKYIDKGNTLTFEYDGTSFLQLISGNINSNESKTYKFMLNSGSTALPFEPYCGGIPSPNPSYPQEIRNIGVYDEASGKYAVEVKCTGKNLAKFPDKEFSLNGVAWTCKNGVFTAIGTATGNNSTTSNDVYYLLPVGTKGSFRLSGAKGNVGVYARITDSNGNKSWSNETFIVDGTEKEVMVYCQVATGGTANDTVYPMLRLAEITDDTYEPYKETTATVLLDEPLRKGDKAYWNGGKLRVERYRYVEVFDGSSDEKWNNGYGNGDGKNNRFEIALRDINFAYIFKYANNTGKILKSSICNRFVYELNPNIAGINKYRVSGNDQGKNEWYMLFNPDTSIVPLENVSAWRAYLSENPITVECELAEPITEEIDIDLGELSMFYPTTILSNDCNANMEVTYIADTKNYIDKLKAKHESDITALKTAIVALGGTV